jgi:hypothetical protein
MDTKAFERPLEHNAEFSQRQRRLIAHDDRFEIVADYLKRMVCEICKF